MATAHQRRPSRTGDGAPPRHGDPPDARPNTPTRLSELSTAYETLRYFIAVLAFTRRDVARLIGAEERTVRRWTRKPDVQPTSRYAERRDDIRYLITILHDALPAEEIGRWLRARNRHLKGERPTDLLALGEFEAVRDLIRRRTFTP